MGYGQLSKSDFFGVFDLATHSSMILKLNSRWKVGK
jgi:hypothetical protein